METVLRIFIIYFFILISLRILGKRELNELTAFELVLLMLIPEMVNQSLGRQDYSLSNAIIGVSTLLSLVFITSILAYRFKKVECCVDGDPVVLMREGKFIPEALNQERIPVEEIFSDMRKHGIETLGEVKWVVLENDGKLSIIPYSKPDLNPDEKRNNV